MKTRTILRIAFAIIAFAILLLAGCVSDENPAEGSSTPQIACINLCTAEKARVSLENSPCIGNPLRDFPAWVCDIAHSPREQADNLPENQCSAFLEGKAKHFVELSPECEFIRQY